MTEAAAKQVATAVRFAVEAQPGWAKRPVSERAAILDRAADLYEKHAVEFFALATREAGKTLADGVAEVREAVDFLRYYAAQAAQAAQAEAGTEARAPSSAFRRGISRLPSSPAKSRQRLSPAIR